MSVEWEVEKYREPHESEDHWSLRKAFLLRWKNYYDEERLLCLARVFINIKLMGCIYPPEVMTEIARLSEERNQAYSEPRDPFMSTRAQGFVTAVEDRRGSESDDCIIVPEVAPIGNNKILSGAPVTKLAEGFDYNLAHTTNKQVESRLNHIPTVHAMNSMSGTTIVPLTSTWQFVERSRGKTKKSRSSASQPVTQITKAGQRSQPIGKARGASQQTRGAKKGRKSSTTTPATNCANRNLSVAQVVRDNSNAARRAGDALRVDNTCKVTALPVEMQPSPSLFDQGGMSTAVGSKAVEGPAPNSEPTIAGKPLSKKNRHRGRRGSRLGKTPSTTADTHADPDAKQPQTPAKRARNADDTASAHGTKKRPKTAPNYAAADAKDHLLVAIKVVPSQGMNSQQSEQLTETLNEAIDRLADIRNEGQAVFFPSFQGKPFLSDGVLKIWCEDDATLAWLRTNIDQLTSPVPNTKLAVIKQSEIARQIKAGLMLPGFKMNSAADIGRAHSVLCGQNTWCRVDSWELWSHDQQEKGLFLTLGIPVTDIPAIMGRQRRMSFRLGSTYIRFFGPHGLQDTPPTALSHQPKH